MNSQITIPPKLQHYVLATANLDAVIDWYRNVMGITSIHVRRWRPGVIGGVPFYRSGKMARLALSSESCAQVETEAIAGITRCGTSTMRSQR